MKYYIYFVTYIYLKIHVRASMLDESSLDNYLHEKMLSLSMKQELRLERSTNKYIVENTDFYHNKNSWQFAYTFNIFNDNYVMLDKDIYRIFVGNSTILTPITKIKDERQITNAKIIEFGDISVMFVVLNEKYVKIIKFVHSITDHQEIQTIEHVQVSDASFFVNRRNLYLIISNAKDDNLVPLSIYEWKDGQFDEQITIHIEGITQIRTFSDEEAEIILMLKEKKDNQFYCNIFEFEHNRLIKKQVIEVDGPIFILPYEFNNDHYVLLLRNNTISNIFRWNGFELMEWSSQAIMGNFETAFVMYENDTPIIFASEMDSLSAYTATSEQIELVKKVKHKHEITNNLDLNYIKENGSDFLIFVGNTEASGFIETFKLQVWQQKLVSAAKDPLHTCLTELNKKLDPVTETPILHQEYTARSMASYSMKSRNNENEDTDFEQQFQELQGRYDSLQSIINNFKVPLEEMIVNGKVIVEGILRGNSLQAENIKFKEVNGKIWAPNQWLSYSKNQTISGGINAKILKVINLETTPEVTLFDDILLNNTNSNLRGSITINNLKINGMQIDTLNDIKISDVFMKDRDLVITGKKTFSHITSGSVESLNVRNKNAEDILQRLSTDNSPKTMTFSSNVIVEDLIVNDIDGVNWNTFKDSVFRYGATSVITGNLRMKNFEADNLDLVTLNGVNVENLMTTSTDQTIDSNLTFHHIYTTNVTATTINGISLTESAATVRDPIINGPVSIEDIHILGDLILNSSLDSSSFLKKNQHIIGTDVSDLHQLYTDKVKIKGNLRVKNLRSLPFSSIVVGEEKEEFDPHLPEKYWMKHHNQIIPVHVEMQGGLTTPHLQTKLLNGNGMFNYMLNNSNKSLPASFAFENATFLGNIYLNDEKIHTPDLRKIDAESVKVNGTFVVHGNKNFKDSVKVKNLSTEKLNDMEQDDLVTRDGPSRFTGKKIFKNLVINGDFVTDDLSCVELNGVDLLELQQKVVYINEPQELESLTLTSVSIENLNVEILNGRIIDEFIADTNNIIESGVIDSLIINGELSIGNLRNLSKINGKDPDILHRNKLKLDEQGALHGHVRFLNNVTIDNLSATIINNINFENLTSRLLYRRGDQVIPARFVFENLKSRNLDVPQINNFSLDPLVDIGATEPQTILAANGIELNAAILSKLYGDNISPCNVDIAMMEAMKSPSTQTWSNMRINGNVTILDEENSLYNIFENVVLTSRKNIIKAPVHFANISVENLITSKHINDIDLSEIFSDALQKITDDEQIISGINFFEGLGVYSATVHNNSDIPVVNSVKLAKIADQIIRKDEVNHIPIRGRKTFFAGLQTEKIQCREVSEVIPEDLVTMDSDRIIPMANFANVEIKDELNLDRLNDHDFGFFLEERLLVSSPYPQDVTAIYSFNNVHIAGNVTTKSINDIAIDDVVFDIDHQEITSKKTFINDVYITGNVDIEMLNGYMVSQIYQKALLKNQESFIKSNVEILKPSTVHGTITTEYLNGQSLETMKKILDPDIREQHIKQIHEIIHSIEQSAKVNYDLIERMPSEIMYIEKSNTVQLPFSNSRDARVLRLKDFVLIHVTGEEEGHVCGLPENCPCPVQHTIQISPENSINSFANKGTQRVYSFDDKLMTAHLMTDSISTSVNCRVNASTRETTTLAWNTPSNITGPLFSYPIDFNGYVSAVEYFIVNGITYAIVGKYYDPSTNSYDLDFIVLKFDKNRETVREIQRQKTSGIWSLKIFYSAQGVNLIVGMLGNGQPSVDNSEKTLVMRFDEQQEQFFLLREVQAYGCSSSVGIVLGTESFIALAHRKYPVLIFRYDPSQENYIYYQNLWEPVPISGISLFYTGGFGISDPYLCVVSERGTYSIYTHEYIEGWKRKFHREMKGLRNLVPFELSEELYLLALSLNMSSVLSVVKFG